MSIFEYTKLNIIEVRRVAIEKSRRLNIMNGKNNARPNGATLRVAYPDSSNGSSIIEISRINTVSIKDDTKDFFLSECYRNSKGGGSRPISRESSLKKLDKKLT